MTEDKVIGWMADRGHVGYGNAIKALEAKINSLGFQRDLLDDEVRHAEAEIAEIKRAALDRYEDWASDPLP